MRRTTSAPPRADADPSRVVEPAPGRPIHSTDTVALAPDEASLITGVRLPAEATAPRSSAGPDMRGPLAP